MGRSARTRRSVPGQRQGFRRSSNATVAGDPRDHAGMDGDRLPDDAMDALAECVRSVVARQRTAPDDELFIWTKNYGDHGDVHLKLPSGPPCGWEVDAVRVRAGSQPAYDVVVAMWTHEEGRSDLSLEVDVRLDGDGWVAKSRQLHVL